MSKYNLTDILEQYRIGSGWTTDFDYDGMLNAGLALNAETDVETMKKVVEDFTDVNYHREASHLYDAIEALEKGDAMEAQGRLNDFYIEIKQTMEDQGMDTSDDLGAYMASKMEEGEAVDLAIEASQEKAGIKEGEGPKEEDQRYIDYLRRSGRDEYADKLVALNPTTLKEESFVLDPIKSEMKMHLKAYSDGTIDGDDLYQAFDEIINGGIKPPSERGFNTKYGMEEVMGIDRKGNKQQDTDGSDASKYKRAAMNKEDLQETIGNAKAKIDEGSYPFDQCLSDNEGKYGKKGAAKVCGYIKAQYGEGIVKEESTKVDFIRALKVDANGTSVEIKSYLESLKRSGDEFDSIDDYVEDFKNYVADKSLQEHFKRFM